MTNYLIYINSKSEPVLVSIPIKPRLECSGKGFNCCPGERCVLLVHQKEIETALSDESKHIQFKDKVDVTLILLESLGMEYRSFDMAPGIIAWLKENIGQTFPLPEGLSVRFEEVMGARVKLNDSTTGAVSHTVALLVQEPKVEDQAEEQLKEKPTEEPYFDQNGKEIKEFAVLKMFHFKGRNERGNGRKNYYMYKWVRLKEFDGKLYWIAMHLTSPSESSYFNLRATAGPDRIIKGCEIVQQYNDDN